MSGHRWDPGNLERHERDGATYMDAKQPVCDFCLGPDPRWQYPAAPMPIQGHPLIDESDDEWCACDECKLLIEAHNLEGLLERCLELHMAMEIPADYRKPPRSVVRRTLRENLLRFMDARRGPPEPFRV